MRALFVALVGVGLAVASCSNTDPTRDGGSSGDSSTAGDSHPSGEAGQGGGSMMQTGGAPSVGDAGAPAAGIGGAATSDGGSAAEPVYRPMPNPASAGLPNPAAYDLATPGVVRDELTSLVWQRVMPDELQMLAQIDAACDDLELAGASDWRVPSRLELLSLVDFTALVPPAIDSQAFPGGPHDDAPFWTSSPTADEAASGMSLVQHWVLSFYSGRLFTSGTKVVEGNVRCVRGEPWAPDYVPGQDAAVGTVFDKTTGLTWQQRAPAELASLADALAYCANLQLGEHEDWRAPSIKELQMTFDDSLEEPALNTELFPGGTLTPAPRFFWSSSLDAQGKPWAVSAESGIASAQDATLEQNVRCVR
jgi:hypothetical protein